MIRTFVVRPACFFFVATFVGFSACISSPASPSASTPPFESSTVPPEEAGSIAGQVLSDEQLPVENASLRLKGAKMETTTDVAGAFSFVGLSPAEYTILVERVGYEDQARTVTVVAGEVAEVKFVMSPVAAVGVGYSVTFPFSAYITFSQAHVQSGTGGGSTWNALGTCDRCVFYANFRPRPVDFENEASWIKPVNLPTFAETISFSIRKAWKNDSVTFVDDTSESILSLYWRFGDGKMPRNTSALYRNMAVENLKGDASKLQYRISGGGDSVTFQQRIEVKLTFAYVEKLPPGFSAFPRS